eukprot:m.90757 g.90757  ORF g.90757 m.90757 type:complete len:382 (-) comp26428_c0_seq1:188-1333(-)
MAMLVLHIRYRLLLLSMCLMHMAGQKEAVAIPLSGYICPSCPSCPDPAALLGTLHPAYTTVNIAFAGFDENGTATNMFDTDGWSLSPADVTALQKQGRKVLLSVGGGNGAILSCSSSIQFIMTLTKTLLQLVTRYGFDGIDWDIEHRSGNYEQCGTIVNTVITSMKSSMPHLMMSIAPQMPNLDPDVNMIASGFNELVPVISAQGVLTHLDVVQPQMYNTWAAVETTAYAQSYAAKLLAGFTTTATSHNVYDVKVPANKLFLGYPSTPKGAGSGFISPTLVAAMVGNLSAHGIDIGGIMTWSIGWDAQAGYPFAKAMAAPLPPGPSPTPPPPPTPPTPPPPPPPGPASHCHSISPSVTDAWCEENCLHDPPNCPPTLCKCT